jgi:hypothetical protein
MLRPFVNTVMPLYVTLKCSVTINFPRKTVYHGVTTTVEQHATDHAPHRAVKVKVKLSLCLPKHHAMKTYWGSGGIAPRILDFGTRWGEWSALRPGHFIPRERAPGTHWIWGWVGPRTGLNTVVRRKIPSPRRKSNPRNSIIQHVP